MADKPDLLILTADLVSAQVRNNNVAAADLRGLIADVHAALSGLGVEKPSDAALPSPLKTAGAVSVRKSLADSDKIISMINGKPYSSLTRHLTSNGLSAEDYRARFGLKSDYPMVAPGYSQRRREVALSLGLGRKKAEPPLPPVAPAKTKRGRPPKIKPAASAASPDEAAREG